jgi:multiple sugar transport system substrate-binding protein
MGGVGLAVSTHCDHKEMAVDLMKFIASPDNQAGGYVQHHGQPAGLKAWQSEVNNDLCGDFFRNTMKTMKSAYVRPQHPGWNEFQEQGADLIHTGIVKNTEAEALIKDLNKLYKSIVFHE